MRGAVCAGHFGGTGLFGVPKLTNLAGTAIATVKITAVSPNANRRRRKHLEISLAVRFASLHRGLRRDFWAPSARVSVILSVETPLCPYGLPTAGSWVLSLRYCSKSLRSPCSKSPQSRLTPTEGGACSSIFLSRCALRQPPTLIRQRLETRVVRPTVLPTVGRRALGPNVS